MTSKSSCRDGFVAHPQQRGAALIIALILLLVVTILAVAGMQNTILQERMAGNMHDRNIAFQYAESGLRDAQRGLPANVDSPIDFSPSNAQKWTEELSAGTRSFAHHVERLDIPADAGCPPGQVCPEDFGPAAGGEAYRITSKGVGGTENAVVILQAVVRSN